MSSRVGSRRVLWTLLGALLLLAGCGRSPSLPSVPAGTPIVLISIDTLRSDRLPIYGYAEGRTPAIDRLARDGVVFERAYSHVPLTLPSHASLFSGLLPPEHNVRDNMGYLYEASRHPSLTLDLKSKGYKTGAAISAFVLRGATGMGEGFDFYDDSIESRQGVGLGGLQRDGQETLRRILPWLRQAATEPFFLFLHLYEPHSPYTPPAAFAHLASPYDGEIAAADAVVAELIRELESLGVYERALILLVSDHGEGLGDHGEGEHGVLLHREALQVPLVVKLPKAERAGQREARPAQLIDVLPTVKQLLGDEIDDLPGRSLFALGDEERPIYGETFYPRLHFGWSDLASLIVGRHHYIEGPAPELYDLLADPGETVDRLREKRRVYADLRDTLATLDRQLAAPSQVDEETQRKLTALGYVGSATMGGDGPLPDPKEHLDTLEDLRSGMAHMAAQEYERAVAAFRAVVERNPKMVDAWESLANSLQRTGQRVEALQAYREALTLAGGAPHLALPTGFLYLELGNLDEAAAHAELALATAPSEAHDLLARVALRRQDLDEGEHQARQALAAGRSRIAPLVTLGQILVQKGELEEASSLTRQALGEISELDLQEKDRIQGLHFLHGTILARLGEGEKAAAAFREEIHLFPDFLRAYSELAVVLALLGRGEEVGGVLREMVTANPTPGAYAAAVKTLRVLKDPASAEGLLRHARGRFPGAAELRGL